MSNFVESRVDTIKKALSPLGFDAKDYADGWDCVVLTLSGNQKANTKHLEIKKAGLQVYSSAGAAAKIAFPQKKGTKKKTVVRTKPRKVR